MEREEEPKLQDNHASEIKKLQREIKDREKQVKIIKIKQKYEKIQGKLNEKYARATRRVSDKMEEEIRALDDQTTVRDSTLDDEDSDLIDLSDSFSSPQL